MYAGLGIFVWFNHKTRDIKDYPLKAELAVLGAALTMHGAVLLIPVIQDKVLIMGFGYSVSLIVWLMLLVYFVGSFFYRLRGLQLLLYPVVFSTKSCKMHREAGQRSHKADADQTDINAYHSQTAGGFPP